MITFLRKIRKSLIKSSPAEALAKEGGSARKPASPAGRYFLYAIGEIALVVIGILIALQINNWNETRKDKIRETKTLRELKANLALNVQVFDDFVAMRGTRVRNMETMIRYLDNHIAYHDSLERYAEGITYLEQIALTTSSYETLKYQGTDIISSDSLRVNVVELHEKEYENFTTVIRDVSMAYFSDRTTPLMRQFGELQHMWPEKEFYYFLKGKITWKSDLISDALDKKEKTIQLIKAIDQELR